MTNATLKTGFYANDVDTFYVTPSGRAWLVGSDDDLPGVKEIKPEDLPSDIEPADDILTPDEAIKHCEDIQAESGEILIEEA